MDETITIRSMKKIAKEFYEARDWDQFHNPKDPAIRMPTEANELLDISRLQSEGQMREPVPGQAVRSYIQEGLVDTLLSLLRFVQMSDIDLYNALTGKVNKNGQRCTIENSKGKNIKIRG